MYSFELVKRRQIRRIFGTIATVGMIGVSALITVAFLGNKVGSFTVNLKNEGVALTMDTSSEFNNSSSYLNATGLEAFSGAHTYKWFTTSQNYPFYKVHNEETDSTLGKETNGTGIRFFKFTFFIKNVGKINATYDFDIKLNGSSKPSNGANPIDKYLRVMVFEDKDATKDGEEHLTLTSDNFDNFVDYTVYAREHEDKKDSEELVVRKEYISGAPESDNYFGDAEMFINDNTLVSMNRMLEPGEYKMYTLLFWLEGYDPECNTIPDKSSLRIGAQINAYPQDEKAD